MRACVWIGLVLVLLSAVACTTEAEEPTATATAMAPTATASGQTVTIVGVVMDVSRSARIITLTESVQGFDTVALTDETEIFSNSWEATLQDIEAGMTVQASGTPGSSGAILAGEVLVIQAQPT